VVRRDVRIERTMAQRRGYALRLLRLLVATSTLAVLGTIATRYAAQRSLALPAGASATASVRVPALHVAPAASGGVDPANGVRGHRATLRPGRGTDGARIVLVTSLDQRVVPALPVTIEIPAGEEYRVIATRRGYVPRTLPLVFDTGNDAKDFEITLEKTTTSGTRSFAEVTRSFATVDLRSVPWSTVILDGKAIGSCPRLGVVVTAGEHTALFAGEVGKKRVTFRVRPGETKIVSVRL
jgi:hypothetical protein